MAKVKKLSNVRDSYADFFQQLDWSYWCTFTTRYELTLKSARRLMERFHAINKRSELNCRMFWVAEKFECKDGYHTHALLYVDELHKDLISEVGVFEVLRFNYQRASGAKFTGLENGKLKYDGFNRLQLKRYDSKKGRGAGLYCTKYVLKESVTSTSEYDLLIN